ncbi:glycosyltransferase [Myxococcaceae bacterium GXIMD 01537]
MTVSVIVPCYNHEKYVTQCLASIDAQDCADLEVIVIDDGSKDATWNRIESFHWSRGRRVRNLRISNGGAHAAINFGLQLATGKFLTVCNSDDYFAPTRLSTLTARLETTGAMLAFSAVRCVNDENKDITEAWPYARDLHHKQNEIREFASVGYATILTNVGISTGNYFFRRELVDEVGYFRPYRYCHDWDFLLRSLLISEPEYVPEPLYFYRLHPGNSFLQLAEAASRECPELMRRYMKAAAQKRPRNKLAPCAVNWPGYFDYFIETHGYRSYMQEWAKVDGPYFAAEPAPIPLAMSSNVPPAPVVKAPTVSASPASTEPARAANGRS